MSLIPDFGVLTGVGLQGQDLPFVVVFVMMKLEYKGAKLWWELVGTQKKYKSCKSVDKMRDGDSVK